ncbi:hypothetical protein DTO021D3_4617 [Paecilomyces variotii]|nr:hypothetical protein DTO032I3_4399 [Paecilomyces variotii]KAJ9258527.1 hypothetical protein DTO195F2_5180 [Paecilomyces variotii]KAJ9266410.1 hypothetical protein DTO212C5_6333 [Paecilomyces variotii]KAJ9278419.1 hypothetical protein DTO021D3_4617 [Paecilomyces variotii]KAJ9339765.1 hypothetical protein DTO027B6_7675 [Paecilomyces variotii]
MHFVSTIIATALAVATLGMAQAPPCYIQHSQVHNTPAHCFCAGDNSCYATNTSGNCNPPSTIIIACP